MTRQYKNFCVSDLFVPARGKSVYTRAFGERHPGDYPVYSASLSAPLCRIDSYDYEGTYLTWTTNGYGGRIQIISGKFSINGDRGIFLPIDELDLDLGYIKRILEPILRDQAVGRIVDGQKNEYTKLSPEIAAKSVITLPIDKHGNLDLQVMREVATKIELVTTLQSKLEKYQEEINNAELFVECTEPYTTLYAGDEEYFSTSIGERVLKKDSHEKGIPVYSANVNKPFACVDASNLTSFDEDSLIWGIDGNFDWNRIPSGTEFATTDHCGRLQVKSRELDPEYLFYTLRGTRLEYGFDRVFRANLDNVRSQISIKIPTDGDGQFSLSRQREIAKKYRELNNLKDKTCQMLELLSL